jgi:hypothetical protein
MLVRLPGQTAGRRVGTPVETLDLMPTLVELFGLTAPAELSGRSLAPALRGEPLPPAGCRQVERRSFDSHPDWRGLALHCGAWKVRFTADERGAISHLGRTDAPGGLDGENLFTPGSPEAELLRQAVARRWDSERPPAAVDEATREMLEALGYVD